MKRETKAKENMKKKRKKCLIGKIFKVIFLIILFALIAYGCYFGYQYYKHTQNMNGEEYDPLSAAALGIDPNKLKDVGRINVLVLGESGIGDGYKLTDSIMVASYNPQTQQASILSIPRDTYVGKRNKNTASQNYLASYKMNSVYRNGENLEEAIECVGNVVGLELDKYILIDTDAIIDIVDAMGGVYFNVPIDMDYDDLNQDLHIHLKAGYQLIDGDKAEQLLRFRHNQDGSTYPAEYGDNDIGRMRTQREFIQETAKQLLKIENATKVLNLLDIVFENVQTNLELQELKYYVPYIFKFNTQSIESDVLPGASELCNGIWIYNANKTKTKEVVERLFTDKVIEVEEEQDDTNTIENAIDNTTKNNVENNISNTTTSSKDDKKEDEKVEEKAKIELLNGTADEDTLKEVKNKLKEEGYEIVKTGTTSSSSKTTIINRTRQSESVVNDIKEILGLGVVSKGSDNTNVDFTIIIGKDYK